MPSPPPATVPPVWTTRASRRRSSSRRGRMPQARRACGSPPARVGGTSTWSSSTGMPSRRVRPSLRRSPDGRGLEPRQAERLTRAARWPVRVSRCDGGADRVDLVAPAGSRRLRLRHDQPPGLRAADRERVADGDAGAGGRGSASAAQRTRPRGAVDLDGEELRRRRGRLLDEYVAADAWCARRTLLARGSLVSLRAFGSLVSLRARVALRPRIAFRAGRARGALQLRAVTGCDVEQRERRVLHLERVDRAVLELDGADARARQHAGRVARAGQRHDQRDAGDDERGRWAMELGRTHANLLGDDGPTVLRGPAAINVRAERRRPAGAGLRPLACRRERR